LIKVSQNQFSDNMEKRCLRCHTVITVTNNKQKYCKDCAYIKKLDTKKKFNNKARYEEIYKLGTGHLNEHRLKNFKAEQKAIKKEFKRLGLRK